MEENNINPTHKVKIKASEILKKFKHQEDRFNFCREKSNTIFLMYRCLFAERALL